MRFKKFSVKSYRQILKAWMTSNDTSTSHSDQTCDDRNDTLKCVDHQRNETLSDTHSIIQLDDNLDLSLDSIPETPDFAEKRKILEESESKTKRKTNKRLISEFIDFEAEVDMDSNHSFCDDIEDTQRELQLYTQSIIDDTIPADTQPIGQLINGIDSRSAEDMQTVYLRSVKERSVGKYKLQYNYDPTIDVYSQEPNESDLEDYQMDSFCVSNDYIEFEESSPQTTTLMEISAESLSPQIQRKDRKKYKRIVFSP